MIDPHLTRLESNYQALSDLNFYLDKRIEDLKNTLVAADLKEVPALQGAIKELIKLKSLRQILEDMRKRDGN